MKEIIEQRKLKGSIRKPKYATRKLSIGLVSCMLGFILLVSPSDAWAEETNQDANAYTEAVAEEETSAETPVDAEAPAEEIFTKEQRQKLVDNGFTEEQIKKLENEARAEKIIQGESFNLDDFINKAIADKENAELGVSEETTPFSVGQGAPVEEFTEDKAKENWDKDVQDKSRWAIGKDQRLVRVGFGDPIKMSDIDYDGVFEDADGNTVIRLVYKERAASESGIWYRARFNFGELDQYIDYNKSYVVGLDTLGKENKTFNLTPVNDRKEREFDLGLAKCDRTDARINLPINLVLRDKMKVADLGGKNYTVQMRLTDADGKRIYAYAPGKTAMDYSTYTKTTSVAIEDNINNTFLKGGKQTC